MSTLRITSERSASPMSVGGDGDGDALLRRARELLVQGELVLASAAGWLAATAAMAAYAGRYDGEDGAAGFKETARRLLNAYRGEGNAAEWVFSALALADNARYDWLGRDGIGRRLDDVQRLHILVQDVADPPSSADDILRQAWQCMDNGSLAVASEKGWQAALAATKTYADAVGCEYRGEYHFEKATRLLLKDETLRDEVTAGESAAAYLRRNASYCVYPKLFPEIVAEDLEAVVNLSRLIQDAIAAIKREAS